MASITINWENKIGVFPTKKLTENGFSVLLGTTTGDTQKITITRENVQSDKFVNEAIFYIGVLVGIETVVND